MNNYNSKFESDLVQEVRNGFIDLRSLHGRLDDRHVELHEENQKLVCMLLTLTLMIAASLVAVDVQLLKLVHANPIIEHGNRPVEIHPDAPRSGPAAPQSSDAEMPIHHYAV